MSKRKMRGIWRNVWEEEEDADSVDSVSVVPPCACCQPGRPW